MTEGVMKVNRKLAELFGWQDLVDVGGMLLGRPPDGAPNSRDQAPVPNWAGSWEHAGPLAMKVGLSVAPGMNGKSVYVDFEQFYCDSESDINVTAPFAIGVMACRKLSPALDPWRMFGRSTR